MADPTGPGVVEGTDNDDLINGGYSDGDGDSVSNGGDLVFGNGGDDTIHGLDGNDTIHGDNTSGVVGLEESDIDAVSIDFASVRAGSETASPNNASAGDSVIYDNVATLSDGTQVSARLVLVSTSDNSLQIDMASSSDYEILLNANNDSSVGGETATFRMEFFDTATGDPVELNPGLVFADIDENKGDEILTINDSNLLNVGVPTDSSLDVTYAGGVLTASGTEDNIDPNDLDSQVATVFGETSSIEFTLTSRDVNSGTNFASLSGQDFNYVNPFAATGDDSILGGEGNDLIFGEAGSDTIDGEGGDDTIYGGYGPDSATGARESFNWSELEYSGAPITDGKHIDSGQVQNTGSVDVTFTIVDKDGTYTKFETDDQNIGGIDGGSETVNDESSLESKTDDDNDFATYRLDFSSQVSNVDFRVNDIDHDSVVKVVAYDASGNQIPVTLTASAGTDLNLSDTDSVAGIDTASATGNSGSNTADDNSILVEVAGPVARIEVTHSNDGGDNSNVNITDVFFDTPSASDLGGLDEGDSILGGEGNDLIYGQGGSDTIDGEAGNDTIYGGGPESTSTHEIFKWSEGPGFANNTNTPNFTQDTGNANITFTTVAQSHGVETEYETSTQDVSELDAEVGSNSSLSSILNGGSNSAKYQWASDTPLENVEFRVNDIDGDGRIVVRAWDENGDPIEVTLSDAGAGLALSNSDGVPGNDTATSTDNNYTFDYNPEHSVLVNIEGPVSRWEIRHEQDGSNNSGINVTDITFDVPSTIIDDDNAGDSLIGGDGDDHIFGQGGDDTITGGDGQDNIDGGTGNDSIDSSSDDAIDLPDLGFPAYGAFPAVPADHDPNNDRDFVDAGSGNDTVVTGDDADTILGGSGNDSIDAGVDTDSIEGGSGNDTIIGGEGNDTIDGGDDNDVIYGGLDPSFPDYLNIPDDGHGGVIPDPETNNGRDLIDGGAGNDTIFGQDDDDTISGGTGNDVIDGGVDEDSITGGEGNDALTGGHGDDTIHGNEGDDTIHGGIGADSLTGGEGDDSFTLGGGDGAGDYAAGGDDQDTFTNIGAGDTIDGNEGGVDYDTLDLTGAGEANNPGGSYSVEYSALNPEDGIVKFFDAGGTLTGTAEFYNIENVICFTPGTAILTPSGEIAVEELKVGDRVVTRDNGLQTIRWIGRKPLTGRDLLSRPKLRPIMIRKGSLGPNLPDRDMMVSPNHRMLLVSQQAQLLFEESEVLVAAKHLVHMDGVHQVDTTGVEYIHFLCDHHEVVLANGAWSESFQPGEFSMGGIGQEQRAEIYELFPELQDRETLENFSAARLTLKRHEAKLLG